MEITDIKTQILIVEDDPNIILTLERHLKSIGYDVTEWLVVNKPSKRLKSIEWIVAF